MATQLKAPDYQHITVPGSPPQHIRIAFVDGRAKRAVDAAVSELPLLVRSATLDDLTNASFRTMLVERNAIVERLNRGADWTDEQDDAALDAINRLEAGVLGRLAKDADEAVMKLIAVAQVGAEGHEVDEADAARAIADARRFFGVGYVHDYLREAVGYSDACEGPIAAGVSAGEWRHKRHLYSIARRERVTYQRDVYTPANPALDDPIQLRFDELVAIEDEAMRDLLTCPAPTIAGLSFKLQILNDGEQWQFDQRPDIADAVTADAQRLSRSGGTAATADRTLMGAFKALRADAVDFLTSAPGKRVPDDEADQARDAHLEVMYGERATSLEGVLAKLRVVFPSLTERQWADHACVDPSHSDFVEGLRLAGFYEQMLWSAISDLADVTGVNLAEQGA